MYSSVDPCSGRMGSRMKLRPRMGTNIRAARAAFIVDAWLLLWPPPPPPPLPPPPPPPLPPPPPFWAFMPLKTKLKFKIRAKLSSCVSFTCFPFAGPAFSGWFGSHWSQWRDWRSWRWWRAAQGTRCCCRIPSSTWRDKKSDTCRMYCFVHYMARFCTVN